MNSAAPLGTLLLPCVLLSTSVSLNETALVEIPSSFHADKLSLIEFIHTLNGRVILE